MLGKTHMAAGITVGLAMMLPASYQSIVLCAGSAAIGAVISDIDAGKSASRREVNKIGGLILLSFAGMGAADYRFSLGLREILLQRSDLLQILTGLSGFFLICMLGKETPHRSFMHSFLAMFLLVSCVAILFEPAALPFGIGFFTHLILDLFNKKGVQLFYPIRYRFRLGMVKANGLTDRLLFGISTVLAVAMVGLLSLKASV